MRSRLKSFLYATDGYQRGLPGAPNSIRQSSSMPAPSAPQAAAFGVSVPPAQAVPQSPKAPSTQGIPIVDSLAQAMAHSLAQRTAPVYVPQSFQAARTAAPASSTLADLPVYTPDANANGYVPEPNPPVSPFKAAGRDMQRVGRTSAPKGGNKGKKRVNVNWASYGVELLGPSAKTDGIAYDFPCSYGKHVCACQVDCKSAGCANAGEICKQEKANGCKYVQINSEGTIATLKREPTKRELALLNIEGKVRFLF